jgi:hypothetical protein
MATKKAGSVKAKKRSGSKKAKKKSAAKQVGSEVVTKSRSDPTYIKSYLTGVTVRYCANGVEREREINIGRIHGLIWKDVLKASINHSGKETMKAEDAKPKPGKPTTKTCKDPNVVTPGRPPGWPPDPTCCYWNGNAWVCPDDWE